MAEDVLVDRERQRVVGMLENPKADDGLLDGLRRVFPVVALSEHQRVLGQMLQVQSQHLVGKQIV